MNEKIIRRFAAIVLVSVASFASAEEPHFAARYMTECDPAPVLGHVTVSLYSDFSEVSSTQLFNACMEITWCECAVFCPNGEGAPCEARDEFDHRQWCPALAPALPRATCVGERRRAAS